MEGPIVVALPLMSAGRATSRGQERDVISLRRMTLGSGYRYLMESVATGDGAIGTSSSLARYYAESGTPPGVFLGGGLAALDAGRGIEKGSVVTEQHLFNLLGICSDPVTGTPLGRQPNRFYNTLTAQGADRIGAEPKSGSDDARVRNGSRTEGEEGHRAARARTRWRVSTSRSHPASRCRWPGRWPIGRQRRGSTHATARRSRSS